MLFGGGDGRLYAFAPLREAPRNGEPTKLTLRWVADCCPADYRQRGGSPIPYARWNKKSPDGPSEIIATPVVSEGRVFASIGQSPLHGAGQGALTCIDGSTGQVIWRSRQVDRTLSDVALNGPSLFAADYSGRLHCFNATTGKKHWTHDLAGPVWCASPVVCGDRVYITTERRILWILEAAAEKRVVARSRLASEAITIVADEDLLLLPTQRRLFAIDLEGPSKTGSTQ